MGGYDKIILQAFSAFTGVFVCIVTLPPSPQRLALLWLKNDNTNAGCGMVMVIVANGITMAMTTTNMIPVMKEQIMQDSIFLMGSQLKCNTP